jgi:hypothetical protein
MGKTWVLDTETKGTGAHIAPLRRGADKDSAKLDLVQLHPKPGARAAGKPRAAGPLPRRFRIVDVLSGRVLAEDVPVAASVSALGEVRSALDALVFVREEGLERWRMLSLDDTRRLFALRDRS